MSDNGNEPTLEQENDILQQRYNSMVEAVQNLELKVGELEQENAFLRNQLINAELNITQQKNTLINSITTSNQVKEDMAVEIAELRAEIKNNGNINQLGN